MRVKHYFWKLLIALDQLGNTLLDGEPDETMSSRMGRTREESKVAAIGCKILNGIDKGHCVGSVEFTTDGSPDAHHLTKDERK